MTAALDRAIAALAAGKVIVLTGDRLRGGDIDFAVAARHASADAVMVTADRALYRSKQAGRNQVTAEPG